MITKIVSISILSLSVGFGLSACGGGGNGGTTTGTGTSTTVGTVTGFGSVYVNGVEFETSDTRCELDDTPVANSGTDNCGLKLGMKVRVEGSVSDDGRHGHADAIYYDDDVEGPISALSTISPTQKQFTIFGLPVLVEDGKTTFDDESSGANYGFTDLTNDDVVEVSGYFDGNQIVASHLERQFSTDSDWEVKGTVSGYSDGDTQFTLELLLVGLIVTIDINGIALPANFGNGVFVEVKVNSWDSGTQTATASEIEIEDRDEFEDNDNDVKLRGMLWVDNDGNYWIHNTQLQFTDDIEVEPAVQIQDLVNQVVKVEGYIQDSVFIADEIELEDGDNEVRGVVTSVDATGDKTGTVIIDGGTANEIVVVSTTETMIHHDNVDISLTDVLGSTVEVEYFINSAGDNIATHIECESCS